MTPSRPVGIELTVAEARSVCAALDLAAHIMECCDDADTTGPELKSLHVRVMNGIVIAEAERALGLPREKA